jgi:hypothetical protein
VIKVVARVHLDEIGTVNDWCSECSELGECVELNGCMFCLDCLFEMAANLGVLDWLVSNRRVEVERLALREA